MDRIEMGIFGALVAILLVLCGLFAQLWDLPSQIKHGQTASLVSKAQADEK